MWSNTYKKIMPMSNTSWITLIAKDLAIIDYLNLNKCRKLNSLIWSVSIKFNKFLIAPKTMFLTTSISKKAKMVFMKKPKKELSLFKKSLIIIIIIGWLNRWINGKG